MTGGGEATAKGMGRRSRLESPGEEATRRWFPNDTDVEHQLDRILERVAELQSADRRLNDESPSFVEASLFGNVPTASRPLKRRTASRSLNQIASEAFLALIHGLPEDHVVIHPEANQEFISRCRLLGAGVSEYALNKALLNVRKAALHRDVVRGVGKQLDRESFDHIGYAAEMAARIVQLQAVQTGAEQPTIDRMLCDPSLRALFDDAVQGIAPGFSLYECRLAALSYRKSGREATMRLGQTSEPDWEVNDVPLMSLDPDDAPLSPAVYCIDAGSRTLFVSATLNLRQRLVSHMQVGDRQSLLPPSLWDPPDEKLVVRWFGAPAEWKPRRARAVAQRMKVEQRAMYNLYALTG